MEYPNWTWHTLLVVALFFLYQTECVLNGNLVEDINEFKYVVGIQSQFVPSDPSELSYVMRCGGAILDDYHIMTAGHCLAQGEHRDEFPEKVKIRLRSLVNNDTWLQRRRHARTLYLPREYTNGNRGHDIAIIKVKRSMKLSRNFRKVQKVLLPDRKDFNTLGYVPVLAGYGIYAFEKGKPLRDNRLRSLKLDVIPNQRCPTEVARSETMICARPYPILQPTPQGMCRGDSGSPVVIKNKDKPSDPPLAIGVVSRGEGRLQLECDNREDYGIYTRVSYFLDWISDVMYKDDYHGDDTVVIDMPQSQSCFW